MSVSRIQPGLATNLVDNSWITQGSGVPNTPLYGTATTTTTTTGYGYTSGVRTTVYRQDPVDQEDDLLPTGPEMQAKIKEQEAYIEILQRDRRQLLDTIEMLREQNRRTADQVREITGGEKWREYASGSGRLHFWDDPNDKLVITPYNGDPKQVPYGTLVMRDTTDPNIPQVQLLTKGTIYGQT